MSSDVCAALALTLAISAAPAMACWCDPPSLRQLMAAEQVAVIEIVDIQPERPMSHAEPRLTYQNGHAAIRQILVGTDLHLGQPIAVGQSFGEVTDGCDPAVLSRGQRLLVPLREGRLTEPLGGCFTGAHDPDSTLTYRLAREFEARRLMSEADWHSLLTPLIERLQQINPLGIGCFGLLGDNRDEVIPHGRFTLGARDCAMGLGLNPAGGWMIAEDTRNDRPILFAAASNGKDPTLVLIAPLEASPGGQLSLAPLHIQTGQCGRMAADLRVDANGFCRLASRQN